MYYDKAQSTPPLTRERLILMMNQEMASYCHAVVAFLVYSQVLKSAAFPDTARALERHAAEDYQHASALAEQIILLGGKPCLKPELQDMLGV